MRAQHHGGSLAATRASHAVEGGYYSGWKQKEGREDGGAVGDNEARDGDEDAVSEPLTHLWHDVLPSSTT